MNKLTTLALRAPGLLLGLPAMIFAALAVAPPLMEGAGMVQGAAQIRTLLAPFCHQWPSHSFHIGGFPMALCARKWRRPEEIGMEGSLSC